MAANNIKFIHKTLPANYSTLAPIITTIVETILYIANTVSLKADSSHSHTASDLPMDAIVNAVIEALPQAESEVF